MRLSGQALTKLLWSFANLFNRLFPLTITISCLFACWENGAITNDP